MNDFESIPINWAVCNLFDVCKPTQWKTITINQLQPTGYPVYGANGIIGYYENYNHEDPTVLIACRGNCGEIHISKPFSYVNGNAMALDELSDKLNIKYVSYYLKNFDFSKIISGSVQQQITQIGLKNLNLKIAPIREQNRIVEKIETLFSEIDAGVESLSKAKIQLERYRQSLLKHAFEGKLTAQWRADFESKNGKPLPTADELIEQIQTARQAHYDKQIKDWELAVKAWENNGKNGKKPTKPTKLDEIRVVENLSNLPLSWKNFYLNDLSDISGGLTKNSKRHNFAEQVAYLRVANVYANELRLDEISQIGIQETEKPRTLLKKDDLLIVEGNGSIEQIGRVAIWNDEISPCYHQNHLIKSRAYNYANPKFILYFLMSPLGRKRIVEVASSTAGLHTLSLSKVSNLILPLTTLEEQNQVIEILDEKLSEVEKSVSEISIQLEKAKLLKSAILHKAFQGKLVPQDPTDPPASQLLDQIKAERLAKQTAKQTAQTATKSKAKANKQPKAKSKAKTKES